MSEVKITHDGVRGTVEIDGQDVSNAVAGASVEVKAGYIPEVTLDLRVISVRELSLENARVLLPDDVAELLQRLGWTPPAATPEAETA